DPMYRDLATILRVLHSVDTADPKSLETLLAPLTNPGNAFHASANELTAVLAAKEGDKARAYKLAEELLVDPATPTDMRQRVTDLATIYKPAETPKAEAAPATPAAEAPKAPAAAAPPAPAKPEAPKPATPSKP